MYSFNIPDVKFQQNSWFAEMYSAKIYSVDWVAKKLSNGKVYSWQSASSLHSKNQKGYS